MSYRRPSAAPILGFALGALLVAAPLTAGEISVPINDPVRYVFSPDHGYEVVKPQQWIPDETDFFHKYTVIKPGGTSPMVKDPVTGALYTITNPESDALMVDCREKGWMGSITYMFEYPQPVDRIRIRFDGKWEVYDSNWQGWDGVHNDMLLYKDGLIVGEQYGYNITQAWWGGPNYGTKVGDTVVWQSFDKEFTGLSGTGAKVVRLKMLYFVTTVGRGWLKNLRVEAWNAQGQSMTPVAHGATAPATDTTGWWRFEGGLLTDDPSRPQVVDGSVVLSALANKRVTVQGGRLKFSDGTPARFWGTGVFHWASSKADIDKQVARLKQMGVNMIRLHGIDGPNASHNVVYPGQHVSAADIDPAKMDLVDYLVAKCKENGIYIYLDAIAKIQLRDKDFQGLPNPDRYPKREEGSKAVWAWDQDIYAVHKRFAQNLFSHRNPYTGLTYAEDPVIAVVGLCNESMLLNEFDYSQMSVYHRNLIGNDLQAWCQANGRTNPVERDEQGNWKELAPYLKDNKNEVLNDFLRQRQREIYLNFKQYLTQTLGVQSVITVPGFQKIGADLAANAESMDLIDSHWYWDVTKGGFSPTTAGFSNIAQVTTMEQVAEAVRKTAAGKAQFVSEFAFCYPNQYATEGPYTFATAMAFQGYDGLLNFSFDADGFNSRIDDNSWHWDYKPHIIIPVITAGLSFLRGDIATPAQQEVYNLDTFHTNNVNGDVPAAACLTKRMAFNATQQGRAPGSIAAPAPGADGFVASADGQLKWRKDPGVYVVNAGRTEAVLGFWKNLGTVTAGALSVSSSQNDFSQIIATSLNTQDLEQAPRVLITATARCENTNQVWKFARMGLVEIGTAPILLEPVKARVTLNRTAAPAGKPVVNILDFFGRRSGQQLDPSKVTVNGTQVSIDIGQQTTPAYWYEVVFSDTTAVAITATDATATEGASPADPGVFTITRTGATTAALTVNLQIGGTATAGSDYTLSPAVTTSVTIPAGQASVTITVNPVNDTTVEGSETVVITLLAGTGYDLSSQSSATVTIADDDAPTVTITASDPDAAEGNPVNTGQFTITRTGSTAAALTVNITVSGTATAGSDYTALPASVTIPAGAASAMLTVTPIDDTAVEGPETVIVTLAPGTGGNIYTIGAASSATVTITSDDVAPGPIVYDGVNYASGASSPNGGTGWSGAWTGVTVAAGAFTYPGMTVEGSSKVVAGNWTGGGRVMATDSPDTCWVAFLAKTSPADTSPNGWRVADIDFRLTGTSGVSQFRVGGFGTENKWVLAAAEGAGGTGYKIIQTPDSTQVTLIVLKLTPQGVSMYLNPTLGGAEPTTAAATLSVGSEMGAGRVPKFRAITLAGAAGAIELDEFRVAATWDALWGGDSQPPQQATVTIVATDAEAAEGTPVNTGTFTITRTGATTAALTVSITVSGTATAGADYTALPATVTIPAGQASVVLTVTPIDDTVVESAETVIVTLAAGTGYTVGTPASATVTIADNDTVQAAQVVAVRIFYNNSAFDGNNPAANAQDDNAIATDKQPLLPGGTATFANYTSYSKGINGIMVDILDLPGTPVPADFVCTVGNNNMPAGWAVAPAPTVTVRAGAGVSGSHRVTLIWPDNQIQKTWLRVAVQANGRTGLSRPYIFYVGNAIGESGDSANNALVNAADQLGARANSRGVTNPAPVTFRWDYNRDRLVNATDQLIARNHATSLTTALRLITVP